MEVSAAVAIEAGESPADNQPEFLPDSELDVNQAPTLVTSATIKRWII